MFLLTVNINYAAEDAEVNELISSLLSSPELITGYLSHKIMRGMNGGKSHIIEIYFRDETAAIAFQKNKLLPWKEYLSEISPAVNILINTAPVETMGSDGCAG